MDAIADAARTTDFDRYLAARLAPPTARRDLIVLTAFLGEIARIPRLVSEPMLGEVRLQWWHDAIEGFGSGDAGQTPLTGNPLADALGGVVARHRLSKQMLLDAVEVRTFELYADPIEDDAALSRYLAGTEGAGFRLAGAILAAGPDRSPHAVATLEAAGEAFGLTRALLGLPFHLSRGHTPFPRSWPEVQPLDAVAASGDPHGTRMLVSRAIAEARARLADVRRHLKSDASVTGRRVLRAAVLPCALIEPYLNALEVVDFDPARQIADIAPLTRVWRLWRVHWTGAV